MGPTPNTKIQLHVEIEDTVMLCNTSKGYGPREIINLALSKVALVKPRERSDPESSLEVERLPSGGKPNKFLAPELQYTWHDGSSLSVLERHAVDAAGRSMKEVEPPPLLRRVATVTGAASSDLVSFIGQQPPGTYTYLQVFGEEACARFTDEGPGTVYLSFAMELLRMLLWPRHLPAPEPLVLSAPPCAVRLSCRAIRHRVRTALGDVLTDLNLNPTRLRNKVSARTTSLCHPSSTR